MPFEKTCSTCETDKYLEKKSITYDFDVRGEKIKHTYDVMECSKCGELVSSPAENDEFLKAIYDKYKSKHGLLLSDEIIAIRERYGISLRDFSKILGMSHITYHRYEKGAIPDPALNNLLYVIQQNPKTLDDLFSKIKSQFAEVNASKIQSKINDVINGYYDLECSECAYYLESMYNQLEPHTEIEWEEVDVYKPNEFRIAG